MGLVGVTTFGKRVLMLPTPARPRRSRCHREERFRCVRPLVASVTARGPREASVMSKLLFVRAERTS